ncbi:hypothetical protein A2331_03185 [Candidatus Falkowbacteria bacterium RIFOXYB2_FULL_34_18]|uniref:Methyltransferase domain-containing protein n=1 Tax=Candidatus Falkowbacteria bacterium RIFOXYD2_FULL_34_120 TaxID=1798007 RepID=A0A1F5TMU1_9BACT|nr:MAG: hypothetical protein A2500_00155 [Candidatus Falkowbacteria bacterium RIFOXYC12_FULL_34_55]OGF28636.1 MAG: hypothetical protein A2331_03185 [Candidatus Falkowbacteria bacterium RIFOXYB2_FULL_34_18]OGF38198.1 MAG: hypothetical protein A2466_00080 [Candidatus Falkowbacteria bacterium RIFOXYC2_FULL_34_220]OGF38308.1 MAG: hypothetical protein A2515_00825 [Candidatus Falkowbacteria bacterium RIFOXYD12_FULL_34_57]OGF40285.1 MAG: hypothetical protein A2531_04530 [Candidatus Falkowbacteria bact
MSGGNKLIDVQLILDKAGVKSGMSVGDLGCGATGHFVFPASEMVGNDGKVYAIDILRTILHNLNKRIKQENIKNIQTIWSDLEMFGATKLEPNVLDIALLVNTLYQSQKRTEVLRETVRLLKPGGKLVIVEWKNISLPFGPPLESRVEKENLKKAAPKLGLKLEEDFFAGSCHYGLIFTKL